MKFGEPCTIYDPPSVGISYRYVERARYYDASPGYEWNDPVMRFSHMEVKLFELPILKFTPKGFWINFNGGKKFVLNSGKKRFAWLTKKEALESFIRRKEVLWQIPESRAVPQGGEKTSGRDGSKGGKG